MKRRATLLFIIGLLSISQAFAQQAVRMDPNTSLLMPEFQALIVEENDEVKVRFKTGASNSESPNVDRLETGDLIIMMDGKRIKTMKDLKETYAAAEKDKEMRIGVRRGEERFILRAIKGDVPENAGGTQTFTRSAGDGSSSAGTFTTTTTTTSTNGAGINNSVSIGGSDSSVIVELGIVLKSEDDQIKVGQVISIIAPQEVQKAGIEADMVIKEINGKKPTSSENAVELINAVKVGEDLTILFEKDGKTTTLAMKKPAPRAGTSVRRRN